MRLGENILRTTRRVEKQEVEEGLGCARLTVPVATEV